MLPYKAMRIYAGHIKVYNKMMSDFGCIPHVNVVTGSASSQNHLLVHRSKCIWWFNDFAGLDEQDILRSEQGFKSVEIAQSTSKKPILVYRQSKNIHGLDIITPKEWKEGDASTYELLRRYREPVVPNMPYDRKNLYINVKDGAFTCILIDSRGGMFAVYPRIKQLKKAAAKKSHSYRIKAQNNTAETVIVDAERYFYDDEYAKKLYGDSIRNNIRPIRFVFKDILERVRFEWVSMLYLASVCNTYAAGSLYLNYKKLRPLHYGGRRVMSDGIMGGGYTETVDDQQHKYIDENGQLQVRNLTNDERYQRRLTLRTLNRNTVYSTIQRRTRPLDLQKFSKTSLEMFTDAQRQVRNALHNHFNTIVASYATPFRVIYLINFASLQQLAHAAAYFEKMFESNEVDVLAYPSRSHFQESQVRDVDEYVLSLKESYSSSMSDLPVPSMFDAKNIDSRENATFLWRRAHRSKTSRCVIATSVCQRALSHLHMAYTSRANRINNGVNSNLEDIFRSASGRQIFDAVNVIDSKRAYTETILLTCMSSATFGYKVERNSYVRYVQATHYNETSRRSMPYVCYLDMTRATTGMSEAAQHTAFGNIVKQSLTKRIFYEDHRFRVGDRDQRPFIIIQGDQKLKFRMVTKLVADSAGFRDNFFGILEKEMIRLQRVISPNLQSANDQRSSVISVLFQDSRQMQRLRHEQMFSGSSDNPMNRLRHLLIYNNMTDFVREFDSRLISNDSQSLLPSFLVASDRVSFAASEIKQRTMESSRTGYWHNVSNVSNTQDFKKISQLKNKLGASSVVASTIDLILHDNQRQEFNVIDQNPNRFICLIIPQSKAFNEDLQSCLHTTLTLSVQRAHRDRMMAHGRSVLSFLDQIKSVIVIRGA